VLNVQGNEEPAAKTEVVDIKNATSSAHIKLITKEYFKNSPIVAEIARCESTYRQFNADGSVLRGKVNSADVGVMQINEKYHLKRSIELGIDIYTLEGNLAYGKYLFTKQGSQPWNASKPCWGRPSSVVVAVNN